MKYGVSANCWDSYKCGFYADFGRNSGPKMRLCAKHVSVLSEA